MVIEFALMQQVPENIETIKKETESFRDLEIFKEFLKTFPFAAKAEEERLASIGPIEIDLDEENLVDFQQVPVTKSSKLDAKLSVSIAPTSPLPQVSFSSLLAKGSENLASPTDAVTPLTEFIKKMSLNQQLPPATKQKEAQKKSKKKESREKKEKEKEKKEKKKQENMKKENKSEKSKKQANTQAEKKTLNKDKSVVNEPLVDKQTQIKGIPKILARKPAVADIAAKTSSVDSKAATSEVKPATSGAKITNNQSTHGVIDTKPAASDIGLLPKPSNVHNVPAQETVNNKIALKPQVRSEPAASIRPAREPYVPPTPQPSMTTTAKVSNIPASQIQPATRKLLSHEDFSDRDEFIKYVQNCMADIESKLQAITQDQPAEPISFHRKISVPKRRLSAKVPDEKNEPKPAHELAAKEMREKDNYQSTRTPFVPPESVKAEPYIPKSPSTLPVNAEPFVPPTLKQAESTKKNPNKSKKQPKGKTLAERSDKYSSPREPYIRNDTVSPVATKPISSDNVSADPTKNSGSVSTAKQSQPKQKPPVKEDNQPMASQKKIVIKTQQSKPNSPKDPISEPSTPAPVPVKKVFTSSAKLRELNQNQ